MPPKRHADNVDEGPGKSDNGMRLTQFFAVQPINQKNFYTEYLKQDNQIYSNRLIAENAKNVAAEKKEKAAAKLLDKAVADITNARAPAPDVPKKEKVVDDLEDDDEEESAEERATLGSKTVVIHLGSRNLRVGLASEPFPKTVPMVIARRSASLPIVQQDPKLHSLPGEEPLYGEEFEENLKVLDTELKARMRASKRRMVPNARDLIVNYNKRSVPEEIVDHNDPDRIEWADTATTPKYITGPLALKIISTSQAPYTLYWPIADGVLNESSYSSPEQIFGDIGTIIGDAISSCLKLSRTELPSYSAAFVIPDLYDKAYVDGIISLILKQLGFCQVLVLQESVCATFGAGISSACVVDVGAQKTSIGCIEEGICIPDSRINIKYGGDDITRVFTKLLLRNSFPYQDLNLTRPFDYLLAEELKHRFCSATEADAAVQLYHVYQRQPDRLTRKCTFKVYDDQILAVMSYFYPNIFEQDHKLAQRRSLFGKSRDIYEGHLNDPESVAQDRIMYGYSDREPNMTLNASGRPPGLTSTLVSKPEKSTDINFDPMEVDSPARVGASAGTRGEANKGNETSTISSTIVENTAKETWGKDGPHPAVVALDDAILSSIACACENVPTVAEDRSKALYSTILITGAGFNFPHATALLEERLKAKQKNIPNISILPPPRELDPQMLVWKGMSIFSKIKIASEFWIGQREYDLLGVRCLQSKSLGYFWTG